MHMRGTEHTKTRPIGETLGTTWSGCYGDLLSESTDVQTDFDKILPQRASRLSIFSNQDGYHIPEGHPSSKLWPSKQNGTKNCFAITASFDWKAKGPVIAEAQKNLYMSLDGPLTVTLQSGERYQVPITGTPDRLSGFIGPSIEAFDIAKSFDFLLGHMLEHECELLEVVRRGLENRIASLSNEQLMQEGAAWFGWHAERRERPIHFVPTTVFNHPQYEYIQVTSENLHFADVSWETMLEHLWPIELNHFSLSWKERREVVTDEYSSRSLTAKQMIYYLSLYGITEKGRRAKAQHLGAWALDCMWAEVRARITRVDAVATRKLIPDNKLEAVLNKEYAKLRPIDPLHGVGDDEDFGNIFESAGTISILMRNLRIIRRILIALIGTLTPAEAEKFWKWEPGFGYQSNGKITTESQTISFGPVIASSPMEMKLMNTPRSSDEETPQGGVRKFAGPQKRAASVGSLNKPRSPPPQRGNSRTRGEASTDATPKASGIPTSFGPDSSGRSRSARRQRQEETDQEPQGVDDLGEQADYSTEEVVQDDPFQDEEGFQDDEVVVMYAERVHASEERLRADVSEIQSLTARPRLLEEMPPWWETLQNYEPSGGITRETLRVSKNWTVMETGVKEPGYTAIKIPMMYEPSPNKGRHCAHEVRKEAIIEVMDEMGSENFEKAIDDLIKSGEVIEWDDPERVLKLPDYIEKEVWRHTEEIAARQPGKRIKAKVDEAFNSFQELYSMRTKSHEGAVRHGFPSYTQRWFERPIYRYQQAMSGLGPFFCIGGRLAGELPDPSMLNRAYMVDKLSPDGRHAAETYLEIARNWTKDSIQGKPIAPIGVRADRFREDERHKMFVNDSGLVPAHLPWIIRDAIAWMKRHPCLSNVVPTMPEDTVDHYGRRLPEGTVNLKFFYLAEGRDIGVIGSMTFQDFWFETRYVRDTRGFGEGNKRVDVMVTTHTAKRAGDPYNGTGSVGQPQGV
eukprot:6482367-Amphidinium_carterae.1